MTAPEPFEPTVCPLPGCGEQLYMQWQGARPIYRNDTAADLADPAGAYTASWEVVCEAGHIVLLPVPTAADQYTFGECRRHEPDEPHDENCEDSDIHRLRALDREPVTP